MNAHDLAHALNAKRSGDSWIAKCIAHDDSTPSMTISESAGRVLVHCHAGCEQAVLVETLAARGLDIREQREVEHVSVAGFAANKRLDTDFLRSQGVRDLALNGGRPAIGFEYRDRAGTVVGTKVRRGLNGTDRGFFWQKGSRVCLYGLSRIEQMHALDQRLVIVEGESDALTLWKHDFNSLGLPGANGWREQWADDFPETAQLYVVIEPDAGGEAVLGWLDKSKLRERVKLVRMPKETKDPSALYLANPDKFADAFEALLAAAEPFAPVDVPEPRIVLRHIADIVAERREPEWLLHKILEARVEAVLAGARGTFKSFIGLDWVMRAARDGHPGVILSGEGGGLDRRVDAWMRTHAPGVGLRSLPVVALERPVNLNAFDDLAAVREAIKASGIGPHVVLIDTLSKFAPGLDENDNAAVSLYLSGLATGIRDELGCTVLLVAHSGHADHRRPRGAYALMCNPDAEYIVERPDMTTLACTVSRERFKDCQSLPPLAYQGEVIELGRVDRYGEPVTSLVMRETGIAPMVRPELRGKAQRQLLTALRARSETDAGRIWTLDELRRVGREAGMHKNTARAAVEALAMSPFMTPTVGGYRLTNG